MKRLLSLAFSTCVLSAALAETPQLPKGQPADAIARVGDQVITFSQLNTQLNSTPVVGLSAPVLGSPERNNVMLTLLDKAISVNLLYLDAKKQGIDQDPLYRQELKDFSDAIIGELYRRRHLIGEIEVASQEVDAFISENFTADTEVTERLRVSAEATIRKKRFIEREAQTRAKLREGIEVVIHSDRLDIGADADRTDDQLVAEFGGNRLVWGEVKERLRTLNNSVDLEQRLESLNQLIDQRLMAQKGRAAGLDRDPGLRKRLAEFSKTRLQNLHRKRLVGSMEPTGEALRAYYAENKDRIAIKERRRIQMVVLPTRAEAEEIKGKIEAGEITIYQAALDHSIDPNAKQTLGDFGWVSKGSGFPALDEVTFALEFDQLGGPVESPAGWHLVRVIDQRDASYMDIEDENTRNTTRRLLLKQRLNDYLAELRKHEFPVVVYEENLNRLFRQEAQWIAAKTREMQANPERAKELIDGMRELVE